MIMTKYLGAVPSGVDAIDYNKGVETLKYFHNRALFYPKYTLTFEELLNSYGRKSKFAVESVGLQVNILELSESRAQDAMEELADKGEGGIPEKWLGFSYALGQKAKETPVWEGIKFVTAETAKEVGVMFQEAGKGVIATLKASKYMIPVIIFGGVGFWLYSNVTRRQRRVRTKE